MNISLDKRPVSPLDRMVFCPLRYQEVHIERCLDCSRLVRADDTDPPRYVVCDARVLERRMVCGRI